MDEGFCSEKCWKESDEYKYQFEVFKNFIKNMDKNQLEYLLQMLEGEYSNYDMEFFNYVEDICKKI